MAARARQADVVALAGSNASVWLAADAVHRLVPTWPLATLLALPIGLPAQMLIALAASVILGSTETLVPATVASLLGGVVACVVTAMSWENGREPIGVGRASRLVTGAGLLIYQRRRSKDARR